MNRGGAQRPRTKPEDAKTSKSIAILDSVHDKLDATARRRGITPAELSRRYIDEGLARENEAA